MKWDKKWDKATIGPREAALILFMYAVVAWTGAMLVFAAIDWHG